MTSNAYNLSNIVGVTGNNYFRIMVYLNDNYNIQRYKIW